MSGTRKTRDALRASLKSEDASIEKRLPGSDGGDSGGGGAAASAAPAKIRNAARTARARPALARSAGGAAATPPAGKTAVSNKRAAPKKPASANKRAAPKKPASANKPTAPKEPSASKRPSAAENLPARASSAAAGDEAAKPAAPAGARLATEQVAGRARAPAVQATSGATAMKPSELFAASTKKGGVLAKDGARGKKGKDKGKERRAKAVQQAFSMAKSEHAELKALRAELNKKGRKCSRSELLRVGLSLLLTQKPAQIVKRLDALPVVAKAKAGGK